MAALTLLGPLELPALLKIVPPTILTRLGHPSVAQPPRIPPLVTIILPARNEAETIATTLEELQALLGGSVAYLVVDDHSTDATREAARVRPDVRVISNSGPQGLGAALRAGVRAAATPWVLFATADGAESPRDLAVMVARITQATDVVEAVFGDRWHNPAQVVGYGRVAWVLNRLGNHLLARLVRLSGPWQLTGYADWTNLAKAYRRHRLLDLVWSDDFRAVVEIPVRYHRRWPQIAILPTDWCRRTAGRSSWTWRRPLQLLEAAWRVSLRG